MKNGKAISFLLYKIRTRRWLLSFVIVVAVALLSGWLVVRRSRKYYSSMQYSDQDTFDGLLSYVRHPPVLCKEALTVGGVLYTNQKIDGDKVICLTPGPGLRKNCTVYSFGINNTWSFDEAMERYGCRVYSFDPSRKDNDHQHSQNIWFYRLGISSANENRNIVKKQAIWKLRTLDYILEKLGHGNEIIDVLKMDIEGSEWDVLEHLLDHEHLNHIYHLCIEVHLNLDNQWKRKLGVLRRLEDEANLRFFSSRANALQGPKLVPGTKERKEQLLYELAWYRDK